MKYSFLVICLIYTTTVQGQSIRINEAVSSNSILFDEDGDTPDWFELHNYGAESVSLNKWTVSDDAAEPAKWVFPDLILPPNGYLLVWASGKDRNRLSFARTLIDHGAAARYATPSSSTPSNWTALDFDDSAWKQGVSGFGYGDGDDATLLPQGTPSVFVRIEFSLADLTELNRLVLDMDYDDAFVAYLNGIEIARANISGRPPAYDANASSNHEALMYEGGIPERFIISSAMDILKPGKNVLAIQGHNVSRNSSDLTIIPFLSAIFSSPSPDGGRPPAVLGLKDGGLHTNFKISSQSETLILSNDQGQLVSELLVEGLPPNHSIGWSAVNRDLALYANPTPGAANTSAEQLGVVTSRIVFSHSGGVVQDDVTLALSGNAGNEVIRYTIDASEPGPSSPAYTTPLSINKNTVVPARIFKQDYLPSPTESRTFIFGASHSLPVVTLVSDPENLFDEDTGIYAYGDSFESDFPYFGANFWQDWERPFHFAFYEKDGRLGTALNLGAKIFGGWSRALDQRSFSLFARRQYGDSQIAYPFFANRPYGEFEALVLRNSGQDWLRTMIKDVALTSLMEGTGLDFQAFTPTVAYINGSYWGIYNLREKVNEHFLASRHDLNANDIDLLERDGATIEGSNEEYLELINYVGSADLTSDNNFAFVSDRIDIDNYIVYQLAQIYFDNTDWPGNNIKFWKHPGGKWRWILFDTDFGFGLWEPTALRRNTLDFALEENGPGWPNPPWSTLLFRKMMTNIKFRNKFINRYADELNTRFLPERVRNHIQSVFDRIAPEIPDHFQRWSGNPSSALDHLQRMKSFASSRPSHAKQHIRLQFALPAIHAITIANENPAKGYVKLNDHLEIRVESWTGDYFQDVPIQLVAIPEPGYTFSHWSGNISSTSAKIELDLEAVTNITPNFIEIKDALRPIVINEINYRSAESFESGDWVELYNPNNTSIDLTNWTLKDKNDDNVFTFPAGTLIKANGYLMLVNRSLDFVKAFPQVSDFVGDFDFGLSSEEDAVRIYDHTGELQDEVFYTSLAPWPNCANGTGSTLELITPDLDNALPENWDCLNSNGSPGTANFEAPATPNAPLVFYPNPVKDFLFFKGVSGTVNLRLYDVSGRFVLEKAVIGGLFLGDLQAGMYFGELSQGEKDAVNFKLIKN